MFECCFLENGSSKYSNIFLVFSKYYKLKYSSVMIFNCYFSVDGFCPTQALLTDRASSLSVTVTNFVEIALYYK